MQKVAPFSASLLKATSRNVLRIVNYGRSEQVSGLVCSFVCLYCFVLSWFVRQKAATSSVWFNEMAA